MDNMRKRVKLTPKWDLYMVRRQKWLETHSNSDTLAMLEAYGVYKGLGGKKEFSLDGVEFSTEKSKNNSKELYDSYIDMISDYIYFYDKIMRMDFSYKAKAREVCGRKYRTLTMWYYDTRDLNEIKSVITKFMCEKLHEPVTYVLNILDDAEAIYHRGLDY